MIFSQCGNCNKRWELGTQRTCICEVRLEPTMWMNKHGACVSSLFRDIEARAKEEYVTPLYTTPPQRPWVGLTDEEISQLWISTSPYFNEDDFAKAVETKLKEKNT